MTQVTVTATGTGNFTIPAGTNQILLEQWGPGGGGGPANASQKSGGGSGAYIRFMVAVTPGDILYYSVGAAPAAGGNGTSTTTRINNSDVSTGDLYAGGGFAGAAGAGAAGGNGGSWGGLSWNLTGFYGQDAKNGSTGGAAATGSGSRGGGGGAGSPTSGGGGGVGVAGSSSTGGNGGNAGTGGGAGSTVAGTAGTSNVEGGGGGKGGAGAGGAGSAGGAPGAGGGGGGSSSGLSAAGSRGQLRYTYFADPSLDQTSFRFYAANGDEAASTPIAPQNQNIVTPQSVAIQLRVRVQNGNATAGQTTDDYHLFASINGGARQQVNDTNTPYLDGGSSGMANNSATTNRLGAGSGSFVGGKTAITAAGMQDIQVTGSNFTELVWSINPGVTAVGSVVDFFVYRNGVPITGSYTITPRLTVGNNALPPMDPSASMRHMLMR